EEAVGAAAVGLGAVHRKIRVLDQLFEIGAVLRRQCDADRSVGRQMMAEALEGLAYRVADSRHGIQYVVDTLDGGLGHGELGAAEPRDQVAFADAAAQPRRDGLQQFVADMVAERVIDALELVDVDIEQGELLAARDLLQLALHLFVEQHAVGQVGERVVMGEMRDLLVGVAAFGDVVDDVDDVADVTGIVADADPRRGDVAPAERLAVPDMLVLEQAAGSERLLVVGVDDVDGTLREQVGSGFADDLLARHAKLFGSDAVGEQITAVARILHRDLRRYVVEDLTQEGIVAVALLLEPLPLGDV